jgi:hypothetical protein
MTVSDKLTENVGAYTYARQNTRAVCKNKRANKSVSRTRKEKCQTHRPQPSIPGCRSCCPASFRPPGTVSLSCSRKNRAVSRAYV